MKWVNITSLPKKSSNVAEYLVSDGISHRVCFFDKDRGMFIDQHTNDDIDWAKKYCKIN